MSDKMKKRWTVFIRYSVGEDIIQEIDELEELSDIIECGPDFRFLKSIEFEYRLGAKW